MLWCLMWHSVHILRGCAGGPALHMQKRFESGMGRLWVLAQVVASSETIFWACPSW